MSGQFEKGEHTDLWDFAVTFYQVPGVEADCLEAQDTFGLDVTALIFTLYRSKNALGFDVGMATELARSLSSRVIEPLRRVRIAMKSLPHLVDPAKSEALRQRVKQGELDAERLTLEALDALPATGAQLDYEAGLFAIANASQAGESPPLGSLLKRLALAARNM